MNGKVQIILVITGIGATSVDAQYVEQEQLEPVEQMEEMLFAKAELTKASLSDPAPVQFFEKRVVTDMEISSSSHRDLDVPAFMRKRLVRNS